ncbi:MAG: hypothetical protein P8020_10155 [Acidobacteriota bacterium]|jgi:hypothetical protein
MVEPRVIARLIRMLTRHLRCDTQLVVLVSCQTGAPSFIKVDDPHFRRDLDREIGRGFRALGLIALDRSGGRVDEKHFGFPWLQDDPGGEDMFERICRQRSDLPIDPKGTPVAPSHSL